ncbi:MAG: autotransporter outer membrane beta-barrel domain-containing protein [Moritella sp.]|uniref:autotransporter family protein n=1 Tax=Moritella sp. TaxID=78556 RepID=UPI001D9C2999|nr:autotransporter outer membrane beta-barrel domain-containing protein [Moritella sp.]NQZ49782.1 autotransporter outer membrane beta-barrel domain-containing protein [Moritella sp.]
MSIKQRFKPSVLSLLVAAYLAGPGLASAAEVCPENTQCETVIITGDNAAYSGNDIVVSDGDGLQYAGGTKFTKALYLKKNIVVTGVNANAIYVADGAVFSNNLNIEAGSDVRSTKGTAIKIDGDFEQSTATNPNKGIYIKGGSTVSGAVNAIDFSGSNAILRIDVDGMIEGNIVGNDLKGNKINFGYNGKPGKNATFAGNRITGVGLINNYGNLTVVAQKSTIVWDADYSNKKDNKAGTHATMTFKVGEQSNLDEPILLVTGKTIFDEGSQVTFAYTGSNINAILGQKIVLLESEKGISGGDNVIVDSDTPTGGGSSLDASPLLVVDDSWLGMTEPEFNGGVADNQLIVRYAVNYEGADEFVTLVASGGGTNNEVATASYMVNFALDKHNSTGSDASAELLALLASSGTDAELTAQLADEMTPDAEGSELRAALMIVDKMRGQVDERTNILRNESALGTANNGWNAWSQLLYSNGSQDTSSTINGYSLSTYGINVGFDRVFDKHRLIGASFSYAHSSADINGSTNTNEVDSFQGMLYSGWFDDTYFIDGNINIGRNSNTSERTIGGVTGYEGDIHAKAEYSSMQLGYQLMAGMKFDLNAVQFEPRIAYNYQWIRTADYQEHGSPASLRYDRQVYSTKQLGVGYNMFTTFEFEHGLFTPSFMVMAYKDLNPDEVFRESATLVMDTSGDRFVIEGDQVGGDMLEMKLNGHLAMEHDLSFSAGINYYQRDDYNEFIVGFTAAKRF